MNVPVLLKAPFPYFGGKSRVAHLVWDALGCVKNYVEPFAGSLAVLLARPHNPGIETVNDMDCLLANFWRAVAIDPDAVAHHADWPVNEADLEARHYWLVTQKDSIRDRLGDPDWYDAKAAGWWVWGISAWIGGGWCAGTGLWHHDGSQWYKKGTAGQGINRQLPHLGTAGQGINRQSGAIYDMMASLSARLRRVRVACGDWSRVCGPSVTHKNGLTGVFLDPPYSNAMRASGIYSEDCGAVATDVTAWAMANGCNPLMRIVVAGYAGEHDGLTDAGWRCVAWEAHGGYGNQGNGRGRANAGMERLWLSPHCLGRDAESMAGDGGLFAASA